MQPSQNDILTKVINRKMLRFLPYLCRNCPPPLHPPPPPPYQCSPCYLYLRFTTTGKLEAQVQKELKKVSCPGNGPDKLISTRKLCESQSKILATNSQSFRVNKIGGVSWAKSIDLVVTAAGNLGASPALYLHTHFSDFPLLPPRATYWLASIIL